ncbi:MAG: hypothetical protein WBG10_04565 [Pseudolabrys sp.]
MKSIRRSHIVVVADSSHGHDLMARLRRMDVAQVTAVTDLEEARRLCRVGNADACLVAINLALPDDTLATEGDAPGRFRGIPALIVAPVVTPHLRRMARRCGYRAAVSATIPSRLLYRRISAVLQGRRDVRRLQRPAIGIQRVIPSNSTASDSRTLH